MSDNKLFNKQILATIEENDDYTMIETFFIDSKRFPSMYEAMTECFRIFWTPYSYKDKVLMEEIRKKRTRPYLDHTRFIRREIDEHTNFIKKWSIKNDH